MHQIVLPRHTKLTLRKTQRATRTLKTRLILRILTNLILSLRTAGGGYWWTFLNTEIETSSLSNKTTAFAREYDARVFSAILNSNLSSLSNDQSSPPLLHLQSILIILANCIQYLNNYSLIANPPAQASFNYNNYSQCSSTNNNSNPSPLSPNNNSIHHNYYSLIYLTDCTSLSFLFKESKIFSTQHVS